MRLILLLVLGLPGFSSAQLIYRNLLQQSCTPERLNQVLVSRRDFHPFPNSPAEWQAAVPDSARHQLIEAAEKAQPGVFPVVPATVALDFSRNGNRTRYESITFTKRDRLWSLALGESIEGKGRFIDAIVDGIWSICEESFWGTSAHLYMQNAGVGLPDVADPVVDLFAAETASTLAWVDYLLGSRLDKISPLVRKRISSEINRRVFVPMRTAHYSWMGDGDTTAKLNNWDPWIISNYLSALLLVEDNPQLRAEAVYRSIRLTDQFINGIGEDGASEEGPHYWSAAGGCLLDVLDLLASSTRGSVRIFDQPVVRNIGAYIYRTHIAGDFFVDVADSHPEVYPEAVMVWRYGQLCGDSTLKSFGAWLYHDGHNRVNGTFHRSRYLYDLVSLPALLADRSTYQPVRKAWMPGVEMLVNRLPNGLFFATHGGHNGESHNHNDVGDCIVYANGEPVLIDVGSGTYTARTFSGERYQLWFNCSPYHNLPTINGKGQLAGTAYRATDIACSLSERKNSLAMNLERCYPPESGVHSWRRTVSADTATIEITDEYHCKSAPASLTQTFMTVSKVDIQTPGVIQFTTARGQRILLSYGKGWTVATETMPFTTEEEKGLRVTWRNRTITRILLTRTQPAARATLRYRIGFH